MDLNNCELEFPVEYPVKIIGKDEDHFDAFVFELLQKHVPELTRSDLIIRRSDQEKYMAVSAKFTAQSRAQVDALYDDIKQHKRILVAL